MHEKCLENLNAWKNVLYNTGWDDQEGRRAADAVEGGWGERGNLAGGKSRGEIIFFSKTKNLRPEHCNFWSISKKKQTNKYVCFLP